MKTIDVDAHVIEPASCWDYLTESEQAYKPARLRKEAGAAIQTHFSGPATREYWVIDNALYGMHDAELIATHSNGEATAGAITLDDLPARIKALDAQRFDVQLIFSSLFLNIRCTRPEAELALTRAWNRWIADRCAASNGRLRWIFVPSLKNPEATARDMEWAVKNGAVGILFRGLEGDRFLDHPSFDPVYAKAQDLDLPICVHIGHGSPAMETIAQREGGKFNRFISDSPNYFAFTVLLNSTHSKQFPQLRWGFFESGCTWVPSAVQTALHLRLTPPKLMELVQQKLVEHNFWLTCEPHEDLPHVARYTGDSRLMLASDYGHPQDVADNMYVQQTLEKRGDVPPAFARKLVADNPNGMFRL